MKKSAKQRVRTKSRNPLKVGNQVFIRTVTNYYVGRIVALDKTTILLDDASWVAWPKMTFGTLLKDGLLDDCEPYTDQVAVMLATVVDVTMWRHALPREQR